MNSLEQRRIMLLTDILKLKMEFIKLKLPGTTESHFEMKERSDLLTTGNAARLLNIHVNTLRRWSNQGILSVHRIGPRGDRRYQRQEVYGLIAELKANNGV